MASELYVETLKGLTSGANANKVIIPSGQTLDITDWSPPAGTVLQVQQVELTTSQNISATSYVDVTNGSITITPKSATSTFILEACVHVYLSTNDTGQVWQGCRLQLLYGANSLASESYGLSKYNLNNTEYFMGKNISSATYEPNSTSQAVCKVQVAQPTNSGGAFTSEINVYGTGYFRVTEIAG